MSNIPKKQNRIVIASNWLLNIFPEDHLRLEFYRVVFAKKWSIIREHKHRMTRVHFYGFVIGPTIQGKWRIKS